MRRQPIWDRRDEDLNPKQRAKKASFLAAQSIARRDRVNLIDAIGDRGLDLAEVLRSTSSVKIVHGKIMPKKRDRIPRSLKFYEKGRLRHAEIANSDVASDIGKYWNAIGKLTETGKSQALRSLRRHRFKDINGRIHTFEKEPKIILKLEARKPKPESFTIYTD